MLKRRSSVAPGAFGPTPADHAAVQQDRVSWGLPKALYLQCMQNLHLFKARVMHSVGVPLGEDEEAVLLQEDQGTEAAEKRKALLAAQLATIKDAVKGNGSDAESRALDLVNGAFRFAFEEFAIRWAANEAARQAKQIPSDTLYSAVKHQRDVVDRSDAFVAKAQARAEELERSVALLERELAVVKEARRVDFDRYLKEVCVLKEQLYRSYKDKDYVGKPVDMLRYVVDDDTAEDVSVDELLRCRRLVRGIEHQQAEMQAQMATMEAEVASKNRFVRRLEEKARATEQTMQKMTADMEDFAEAITRMEGEAEESARTIDAATRAKVEAEEKTARLEKRLARKRCDDQLIQCDLLTPGAVLSAARAAAGYASTGSTPAVPSSPSPLLPVRETASAAARRKSYAGKASGILLEFPQDAVGAPQATAPHALAHTMAAVPMTPLSASTETGGGTPAGPGALEASTKLVAPSAPSSVPSPRRDLVHAATATEWGESASPRDTMHRTIARLEAEVRALRQSGSRDRRRRSLASAAAVAVEARSPVGSPRGVKFANAASSPMHSPPPTRTVVSTAHGVAERVITVATRKFAVVEAVTVGGDDAGALAKARGERDDALAELGHQHSVRIELEEQLAAAEREIAVARDEAIAQEARAGELSEVARQADAGRTEAEERIAEYKQTAEAAEGGAREAVARMEEAQSTEATARREMNEAIALMEEAEQAVQDTKAKAVAVAEQTAEELAAALARGDELQGRCEAVTLAYVNVASRLDTLKTRAGLHDYKKRAAEHHFRRAEEAIAASEDTVIAKEAECAGRVADARTETQGAQQRAAEAERVLAERTEAHEAEIRLLTERTEGIQAAFEALLEDFNRLRQEYLDKAAENAVESLAAKEGGHLSSAASSPTPGPAAELHPAAHAGASAPAGFGMQGITGRLLKRRTSENTRAAAQEEEAAVSLRYVLSHATVARAIDLLENAARQPRGLEARSTDEERDEANRAVGVLCGALTSTFSSLVVAMLKDFGAIAGVDDALEKARRPTAEGTTAPMGDAEPTLGQQHLQRIAATEAITDRAAATQQVVAAGWDKLRTFQSMTKELYRTLEDANRFMATSGLLVADLDPETVRPAAVTAAAHGQRPANAESRPSSCASAATTQDPELPVVQGSRSVSTRASAAAGPSVTPSGDASPASLLPLGRADQRAANAVFETLPAQGPRKPKPSQASSGWGTAEGVRIPATVPPRRTSERVEAGPGPMSPFARSTPDSTPHGSKPGTADGRSRSVRLPSLDPGRATPAPSVEPVHGSGSPVSLPRPTTRAAMLQAEGRFSDTGTVEEHMGQLHQALQAPTPSTPPWKSFKDVKRGSSTPAGKPKPKRK